MSFDSLRRRLESSPECLIGGGASEDTIASGELALGVVFHPGLREYLARFGWLEIDHREFYGLGPSVPGFLDLVAITQSERTEATPALPTTLIPLLNDGGGNLYCVVCEPCSRQDGTVVRWDHESPRQTPKPVSTDIESWLSQILDEQV